MAFFEQQNNIFYEFLNEEFKLKSCKTWDDVAKNVNKSNVRETYKLFAKLFPLNNNYLKELENYKSSFSSIHYATLKGNKIIDEIVRFSLYSDKIIVFHPLQNPAVTNEKIDPRKEPRKWLPDFVDALFFYITIQKWVKSGIVELIINPYEYDLDLRDQIDLKVKERILKMDSEEYYKIEQQGAMENIAEQLAFDYKNLPKDKIIENLLKIQSPKFTENEAKNFADLIIDVRPNINPLWDNINKKLYGKKGMITPTKGGGPLESLLLLSEVTGGKIYTPSRSNWYQIKDFGLNDFWVKTNYLYSKIPLTFLNNVDTDFALNLRKDDRLSGIRLELNKIYSELESIDISNLNESKMKFIQEGFLEEIKKADSEWKTINKQAEIARKRWISSHAIAPIVTNEFSILPIALTSGLWFIWNEISNKNKLKNFQVQNPISVYVDLKNNRQHFWTELKNCIL